jgi:hypothetical protein
MELKSATSNVLQVQLIISNTVSHYGMLQGDIENWSLPVELWVKQVKQGGPLEPTQEEWLTLNKKLVEQGLAIPVRW